MELGHPVVGRKLERIEYAPLSRMIESYLKFKRTGHFVKATEVAHPGSPTDQKGQSDKHRGGVVQLDELNLVLSVSHVSKIDQVEVSICKGP